METGSSYQTPPTAKKTPDTGQEDSDIPEVMRSSDRQVRARGHVRRGRQANASTTGCLSNDVYIGQIERQEKFGGR